MVKLFGMPTGWLNICKKLKLLFSIKTDVLLISETHFITRNIAVYLAIHCITQCTVTVKLILTEELLLLRSGIRHYEIHKYQREFLLPSYSY